MITKMKKIFVYLLPVLSASAIQAQEVTCFKADFNDGIPAGCTVVDYAELPVGTGFRKRVGEQWYCGDVFGADGKAVMSTSHRSVDLPTDNWLITPKLSISTSGIWLSWDARSLHYDLRDGYKVMVSETDSDPASFREVMAVEEETYGWNHRLLPLGEYEGKDIYIAFVHDSRSRFILALDNLFVGEFPQPVFQGFDRSRRFCGNTGTAPVSGSFRNNGKAVGIDRLLCTTGDGQTYVRDFGNSPMATAEETEFTFDVPVEVGKATCYAVDVVTSDGMTTRLMEDSIICSEFPRTLLVEKCTGTWCTSCTGVIPYINQLKERYGDELVCIESHSAYINTSGLSYELYDEALGAKNYPAIFYNRNLKSPQYSAGYTDAFRQILLKPTRALVELEAVLAEEGNFIDVTAQTVFAGDQDNADGRFRLGFAIIEKRLQLPYNLQKSNATILSQQEYAMMSSPIEKDFMFFHDVVRGTASAFAGLENSLPQQIEGGQANSFRTSIQIPENVSDKNDIAIVAFVMDTEQGELLNTAEVRPAEVPTGIGAVQGEVLPVSVVPGKNGGIEIRTSGKNVFCEVEVMDATGRVLVARHVAEPVVNVDFKGQGCYLVRVRQGKKMTVKKIIL